MKKIITHIIRIKKFKPYYELYSVNDKGKLNFLSEFNDISLINIKVVYVRIVLSSVLCVDGKRELPPKTINSKVNRQEFYFSHQVLSNVEKLKYSLPIILNGKLRQLWLNKIDFNDTVQPVVNVFEKKIESIISEKFSFLVSSKEEIKIFDGKNLSLLKLDQEDNLAIEISSLNTEEFKLSKSFQDLIINPLVENVPNFNSVKKKNFFYIIIFSILFFFSSHIFIFYLNQYPYTNLRVSYFLNSIEIKGINYSDNIINQEKNLSLKFNEKTPDIIIKLENYISEIPDFIIEHLIKFEFNYDGNIILTLNDGIMPKILKYYNTQNNLNTKIESLVNIIKIEFNLNDL